MPQKTVLLPKLQEDEILVDEQGWIYPCKKWREDDAEFALGLTYDPNAPDETLAPRFRDAPVRFTMTVEDVMHQNLVANPYIKIVVPMGISLQDAYMGIKTLKPSGRRIQVELDFVASRIFMGHLIVRMNPKARLHIIVNC